MSRVEIEWPDRGAELVRAARGRLAVAGEGLRRSDLEARLQRVARVLEAWTSPDSPWRRELREQLAAAGPLHPATLAEGLEGALAAWDPGALVACARREIEGALDGGRRTLAPFSCTSVLAGGSIPMPTLLSGLLPLALASPVLLRESAQDPVTPGLLARSVAASDPGLGRCLEVVRFPVEDEPALDGFLDSPCVVATGSDETIAAVRRRLAPGRRFVAYGHRLSIAVLGPELARDETRLARAAEGLALDVARWDQDGCLSPVVAYLVDSSPEARRRVAGAVAEALDRVSARMPRGELPTTTRASHATERAEARMRSAASEACAIFEGTDFCVALEADARPRPAPLARFLRMHPVESPGALAGALAPFAVHLSSAAVAGFKGPAGRAIVGQLTACGVTRITTPGSLQTPAVDWPHDGMPLFLPMARFASSEVPGAVDGESDGPSD